MKGKTGTSLSLELRSLSETRVDCRNCLGYSKKATYTKGFCKTFKIPINDNKNAKHCKNFNPKQKKKKAKPKVKCINCHYLVFDYYCDKKRKSTANKNKPIECADFKKRIQAKSVLRGIITS